MNHHWIWWNVFKSEITSDETADLWQNKLESMGVVFSHDEFPEGRTFPNYRLSAFSIEKVKKTKKIFFVFFSVFQKKGISECLRATQWKFDYFPLWKTAFCIWFQENFNYRALLLLRRHERSECHFAFAFAFWGLGLAPSKARVGILHGSGKVPSVCPCSMLLKSLVFLRHLQKLPLT